MNIQSIAPKLFILFYLLCLMFLCCWTTDHFTLGAFKHFLVMAYLFVVYHSRICKTFWAAAAAVAAASQTKPQTEDLYLKKIHKINALLHQLLETGGWAGGQPGPPQQGVFHPAAAVRVGGVSPLLARAITVLFSWELPRKIFLGL